MIDYSDFVFQDGDPYCERCAPDWGKARLEIEFERKISVETYVSAVHRHIKKYHRARRN